MPSFAAFFFLRTSNYVPCITFEDFTGGSQSVDAQLVGFALKRTLSQFPDVTVVDRQEFNHLLTIEKSRKEAEQSKARGIIAAAKIAAATMGSA